MYRKLGIKKSLLLFITILILFSINFLSLDNYQQANAQNNYNNTNDGNLYTNPSFGINMTYPNNWISSSDEILSNLNDILESVPSTNITLTYLALFYANASDDNIKGSTPPTVALTIENNDDNKTLQQYTELLNNSIVTAGGKNIMSQETTLANNIAREINYTSIDLNTNDILQIRNIATIIDNKIYNFINTAQILDYKNIQPSIKIMRDSLNIQQQDEQQ